LNIIDVAEIFGLLAFALSGFLIAVDSKLDLLGIFISAFLTALGGGVIRDVIVKRELFAFSNNYASVLVIAVIIFSLYIGVTKISKIEKHPIFIWADTLGMVSFALSGALISQNSGFNFFGVILISLITAVGGGVMRDILINKVPIILVSEFYGTVALLVGSFIYLLGIVGFINSFSVILVFIFGVWLRFYALKKDWHLPKVYK
jgi:uncharacterized membrane protein YeiH